MSKELMNQVCKFEIGAKVTLAAQVFLVEQNDRIRKADMEARGEKSYRLPKTLPQLFIVIERHAIECYGGLQVSYKVTCHDEAYGRLGSGSSGTLVYSEPELVAYPEV